MFIWFNRLRVYSFNEFNWGALSSPFCTHWFFGWLQSIITELRNHDSKERTLVKCKERYDYILRHSHMHDAFCRHTYRQVMSSCFLALPSLPKGSILLAIESRVAFAFFKALFVVKIWEVKMLFISPNGKILNLVCLQFLCNWKLGVGPTKIGPGPSYSRASGFLN